MNVFARVEERVVAALEALKAEGALPADLTVSGIEVTTPRDPTHGDLATNAALVLAKPAGMKPRDIAEKLKEKLEAEADMAQAEVAGPGFLNLTFKPAFWHGLVRTVLEEGADYGRSDLGKGETVNIEYVSTNPTGPMHVGHCRGAVFGDALCKPAGVRRLQGHARVLRQRRRRPGRRARALGVPALPRGAGRGHRRDPRGSLSRRLSEAGRHGAGQEARAARSSTCPRRSGCRSCARPPSSRCSPTIKDDLAALNIKHDMFFSEASLTSGKTDKIKAAIEALRKKGLIYEGRLPRPKGHDDEEWEDREQTLFKSTAFGDDVDRALMKSDGSYTYFAGDVAYHYDKLQRGFRHLINVFGADHIGYISRIKATVAALSEAGERDAKGKLKPGIRLAAPRISIQGRELVKLFHGGEPVQHVEARRQRS